MPDEAEGPSPADLVVRHMQYLGADAAIVVDGNGDSVIADLVAAGWTLEERVDLVAGKRIRFVHPPAGVVIRGSSGG